MQIYGREPWVVKGSIVAIDPSHKPGNHDGNWRDEIKIGRAFHSRVPEQSGWMNARGLTPKNSAVCVVFSIHLKGELDFDRGIERQGIHANGSSSVATGVPEQFQQ